MVTTLTNSSHKTSLEIFNSSVSFHPRFGHLEQIGEWKAGKGPQVKTRKKIYNRDTQTIGDLKRGKRKKGSNMFWVQLPIAFNYLLHST